MDDSSIAGRKEHIQWEAIRDRTIIHITHPTFAPIRKKMRIN